MAVNYVQLIILNNIDSYHKISGPSAVSNGHVNTGLGQLAVCLSAAEPRLCQCRTCGSLNSASTSRAAKFTKNKNDQWNHAGGFATTISTSLPLKM